MSACAWMTHLRINNNLLRNLYVVDEFFQYFQELTLTSVRDKSAGANTAHHDN